MRPFAESRTTNGMRKHLHERVASRGCRAWRVGALRGLREGRGQRRNKGRGRNRGVEVDRGLRDAAKKRNETSRLPNEAIGLRSKCDKASPRKRNEKKLGAPAARRQLQRGR